MSLLLLLQNKESRLTNIKLCCHNHLSASEPILRLFYIFKHALGASSVMQLTTNSSQHDAFNSALPFMYNR
jgi:hypothetical protein